MSSDIYVNIFYSSSSCVLSVMECHVCLSVCLSVGLSICLSVCLSICLLVRLPVCLSACLSVCLYVCLFVCLSVCLPVCLSVSPSNNLVCLYGPLIFLKFYLGFWPWKRCGLWLRTNIQICTVWTPHNSSSKVQYSRIAWWDYRCSSVQYTRRLICRRTYFHQSAASMSLTSTPTQSTRSEL